MITLGIIDEIPQIVIAIVGGFLQQVSSPKQILIVSSIPQILSWVLLFVGPSSVPCLLMSRACAGLGIGLISANVYLPSVASYKFLGPFKMIEVGVWRYSRLSDCFIQNACWGVGSILYTLALLVLHSSIGIHGVALLFAIIPTLGMIGLFLTGCTEQ